MAYAARKIPVKTAKDTETFVFGNVRGVDFRSDDTETYRTPDSVNMYRSSLGIWETHPGFRSVGAAEADIYGIERFPYRKESKNVEKVLLHIGNGLFTWDSYPDAFTASDITLLYEGIAEKRAAYAVFDGRLLIADGEKLLVFDGETVSRLDSIGYVPQTWTGKTPDAKEGTVYQQRNMINPYFEEGFTADGTSKVFTLSLKELDALAVTARRQENGTDVYYTEGTDFTVDREKGTVTFTSAPAAAEIEGVENLFIKAAKTTEGYADSINRCTSVLVFDNRVFLSGNPEYPDRIFWSGNADMTYFGEIMHASHTGGGSSPVTAMQLLPDNRFLTVKGDSLTDGSYAVWSVTAYDDDFIAEGYTAAAGNSNIGCVSPDAHRVFTDDNVFLSKNGLNAISRTLSVSYERNVEHRSTLVDSRLTLENTETALMEQFSGRLYILFGNGHCYVADSSMKTTGVSSYTEYEWAYLEGIGAYSGQTAGAGGAYEGGEFTPPTMLKCISGEELYFAAGGTLFRFAFDMKDNSGEFPAASYHFNGRHIGDYVTSPFSWFGAKNRYKRLIRKYGTLYCDTRSRSSIEVTYRTEKTHFRDSKALYFSSGLFSFNDVDFSAFTFNTLAAVSFVLKKMRGKCFRRMQVRVRSRGIYNPVAFKEMILDAYILSKRLR